MPTDLPPRRPRKEPVFEHPPQWIHESVAALLGSRRELRKLAVLRLVNRIALQPGRCVEPAAEPEVRPPSAPSPAAPRSRS